MQPYLGTHFSGKSANLWGIRYRGWREDLAAGLTTAEIAAKQWIASVETALRDLGALPENAWLNLRYEEVVTAPVKWFERIMGFCKIEASGEFYDNVARSVRKDSVSRWIKEIAPQDLEAAMPILEPTMKTLGYV